MTELTLNEVALLKEQMGFADLETRLYEIEAENKALKAANKALRARIEALEPKPIEPIVKVTNPIAAATFSMPSNDELDRLATIALAAFPELDDVSGPAFHGSKDEREEDWWAQFDLAFLAIGDMKRLSEVDRKKYLSFHIDVAESYLRTINKHTRLRANPFLCALLAWGDVPYANIGRHHEGLVVEVGLSQYVGRASSDESWKRVLQTERLFPMSPPAIRPAARSPSHVTQLQMVQPTVY